MQDDMPKKPRPKIYEENTEKTMMTTCVRNKSWTGKKDRKWEQMQTNTLVDMKVMAVSHGLVLMNLIMMQCDLH